MEKKYIINGSTVLSGEVNISGAKNSALPILAATVLATKPVTINNVPPISDVLAIIHILREIGLKVDYEQDESKVIVNPVDCDELVTDLTSPEITEIRASVLIAGSLLGKSKKATLALPGGCKIGTRPIDLHLKAFSNLGATIKQEYGNLNITVENLKGSEIYLDFPSVGATENALLASVLASGVTTINNSAIEPEIVDLCNFINSIGGEISGIGTESLVIKGVDELGGGEYSIIPDRIEAGTYMLAGAITRGKIKVNKVCPKDLNPITTKLRETGVVVTEGEDFVEVDATMVEDFNAIDIKTLPHPGFPTDMQSQFASLLAVAKGTSVITETIFENRFMYATEFARMGCDVKVDGRNAWIEGVKESTGAKVKATDLRSGAGLVLLALASKGDTEISDVFHIERGYSKIEEKLSMLGAKIKSEF